MKKSLSPQWFVSSLCVCRTPAPYKGRESKKKIHSADMTGKLKARLITQLAPHSHQSTEWSTCSAVRSLTPVHCISPGARSHYFTLWFSNPLPPSGRTQVLPQQKRRSSRFNTERSFDALCSSSWQAENWFVSVLFRSWLTFKHAAVFKIEISWHASIALPELFFKVMC